MTKPIFKLSRVSGAPVSDGELIADLKRVAQSLNTDTVPQKKYGAIGTFDYSTVIRRFGSWNNALRLADLSLSNEVDISDERLFENLLTLWQHLGRQPRRSELSSLPSNTHKPHTTGALARGLRLWKRSFAMSTEAALHHPT